MWNSNLNIWKVWANYFRVVFAPCRTNLFQPLIPWQLPIEDHPQFWPQSCQMSGKSYETNSKSLTKSLWGKAALVRFIKVFLLGKLQESLFLEPLGQADSLWLAQLQWRNSKVRIAFWCYAISLAYILLSVFMYIMNAQHLISACYWVHFYE